MQFASSTRLRSIASLFFVSTAFSAAATPNVVEGTAKTVDGRPVPGATIRVSGATGAGRGTTLKATTDARGNYRINVPLGHYNVERMCGLCSEVYLRRRVKYYNRPSVPGERPH